MATPLRPRDAALDALDDLAQAIASGGTPAVHERLQRFAQHARSRGVSPVLLEVVAGADEPDVARQRAFGMAARALARRDAEQPERQRQPQSRVAA